MTVAVAAPNGLAADAGRAVAAAGGNAVDVALATMLTALVTEPGICSLGGGAYLTVAGPNVDTRSGVEVVDANCTMPGLGLELLPRGDSVFELHTDYGGGVTMHAGHGSVATPGTPIGMAAVHGRHGRMPWRELFEPALAVARDGFMLGEASRYYMNFVHDTLYGWHPPSWQALHHPDGRLLDDEPIVIAGLVDTLEQLASEGIRAWTHGDIGQALVDEVRANGGLLTMRDLAEFTAVVRPALVSQVRGSTASWQVATNPAPAIGGVTLSAMLQLLAPSGWSPLWSPEAVARMIEVQDVVLARRVRELDASHDREAAGMALLASLAADTFDVGRTSPSTLHVSAVDDAGGACAITTSTGYGSGVMPEGTGVWLNNCLGEVELNPHGLHAWEPGQRLPSNMAPTVARSDNGDVLSIGSPGADRITTALVQTLAWVFAGAALAEAVAAPRLHVRHDARGRVVTVAHEQDLDVRAAWNGPVEPMHANSMFFGGVGAALLHADGTLDVASDPRRTGGTAIA